MSDKKQNWMELAILWPAKKVSAAGRANIAAPVIVEPGASVVVQKIDYPNGKPEGAPSSRLMLVCDRPDSRQDNGSAPADDDIPF